MKGSRKMGWCIPITLLCTVFAFAFLTQSYPCRADDRLAGPTGADAPLSLLQTYEGTYAVAYAGKATYLKQGNATFNLAIPGTPVAAWLYLAGTDVRTEPGEHFPAGDADVHVVVTNGEGGATYDVVPVLHRAGRAFLNRLDITASVVEGDNAIAVTEYGLNHPEGAFAVAVYSSPALARTRTDVFDGADRAWYLKPPPLGPDTEAVISTFEPYPDGPRDGRVLLVTGGAEPRQGDEVFLLTGAGDPAVLIPCSDGDGLPEITDRRWRLTRRDATPRGNDRANSGIHLEAVAGAISLAEDKLGVLRKNGGRSLGPELDMLSAPYVIPAGHSFSAFQVQSEDPEPGDKLTLYLAVNSYAAPEAFNPVPDFSLAKAASLAVGAPGDIVAYEYTLTNTGGTTLAEVALYDDVVGDLGTVTLGVGEVRKLYVYFHVLPECGQGGATLDTGCGGEPLEPGSCSLTNRVEATWGGLSRTAQACVEIRAPSIP